ncbi:MAG TPA: triose-phosphate isomerase [Usitatibacter sp.]|nr:triose-phosphate isomerase [Usitatibacter sp.]
MRSRLVAGNWKLNGTFAANEALLKALLREIPRNGKAGCAVCVPYPYLAQARDLLRDSGIAWGSQDCSRYEKGAYTGDVSAAMIAEFGARYAIVGHSERRTLFGDTDAMVVEKFTAAKRAGLTPIFCVGETLQEREGNATEAVLARQVDALLAKGANGLEGAVIAYEPVWAIGTGKTATSQQAEEAHDFIRRRVAAKDAKVAADVPILYGGSVKAANAAELFAMPDVDGGLVGGASLVAEEFTAILKAAG